MNVKVMVAFSNMLFSEGVCKVLKDVAGIEAVEALKPGENPGNMVESFKPDIILVDFTTLYNAFGDIGASHGMRLILLDTCCGEENIISAVLSKGIKGVLVGNATPAVLKKAVRAVAQGEVWLDKVNVKNLLAGLQTLKNNARPALSDREWEVVHLVGQGQRNKEIAQKLCISEPTVKTHLQRIFQKLDIRSRPQLITFAIKNQNQNQNEANPAQ